MRGVCSPRWTAAALIAVAIGVGAALADSMGPVGYLLGLGTACVAAAVAWWAAARRP